MSGADFHSFFFRVDKQETNLSNANLEGAVITNTDLSGVIMTGTIMPDGSINN